MNIKEMLPTPERLVMEVIIVAGGVLGAAWLISKFPKLQAFVQANSVTVKNSQGDVLY